MRTQTTEGLKDSFLQCRDFGHAWRSIGDHQITADARGRVVMFHRHIQCTRCRTIRSDTFHVDGSSLRNDGRSYRYPDGYLMQHKTSPAEFKFEVLRRLIEKG
jgi:hypothetical protein